MASSAILPDRNPARVLVATETVEGRFSSADSTPRRARDSQRPRGAQAREGNNPEATTISRVEAWATRGIQRTGGACVLAFEREGGGARQPRGTVRPSAGAHPRPSLTEQPVAGAKNGSLSDKVVGRKSRPRVFHETANGRAGEYPTRGGPDSPWQAPRSFPFEIQHAPVSNLQVPTAFPLAPYYALPCGGFPRVPARSFPKQRERLHPKATRTKPHIEGRCLVPRHVGNPSHGRVLV